LHPSIPILVTLSISYSRTPKTSFNACSYARYCAANIFSSISFVILSYSIRNIVIAIYSISLRCSSALPPCPSYVK
jgi:hypothetical protein